MASVAELPPEVLLEIFEYLPLRDLVCMAEVCPRWKPLLAYRSLYKNIWLTGELKLDQILRVLSRYAPVIESVSMTDRKDTNAILKALAECPALKRLKMKNCSGTKSKCVSTAMLIRVFKQTQLRDFAVKRCTCFVHVLSILPPEPANRKMIGFSSNGTGSATQRIHFLGPHFLSMLRTSADSLTQLHIVDANINFLMTDFSTLFRLIGSCAKLRQLSYHVSYLPLTDENFRDLYSLRNLTSLSLKSLLAVSEDVFQAFFERQRTAQMRRLELYDLHAMNVATVRRIGEGCPNLEALTLCHHDSGRQLLTSEALAELPAACSRLQVMRLSCMQEDTMDALRSLSAKPSELRLLEFQVLPKGEYPSRLRSQAGELLPTFDVKISRFGRVTCHRKRQYLIRSTVLGEKC